MPVWQRLAHTPCRTGLSPVVLVPERAIKKRKPSVGSTHAMGSRRQQQPPDVRFTLSVNDSIPAWGLIKRQHRPPASRLGRRSRAEKSLRGSKVLSLFILNHIVFGHALGQGSSVIRSHSFIVQTRSHLECLVRALTLILNLEKPVTLEKPNPKPASYPQGKVFGVFADPNLPTISAPWPKTGCRGDVEGLYRGLYRGLLL